MGIQSCCFCVEDVGLNVFKTGIHVVQFLPVFRLFLVFLTVQCRLRHTGSSGLTRVFDYDLYRRMRAYLLVAYICATTHGPTSLSF